MPGPSSVRWSQLKVGIVGISAFAILGVFIFLLTSSQDVFHRNVLLRTYMIDASGLTEGTIVRLNGITIGELDKVRLTNSPDPRRTIEFDMSVKPSFLAQIPVDSTVGIAAVNLLGDKFLDITKGRSAETVKAGGELKSAEVQDIPQLLAEMNSVLNSFQTIVGRVDSLLAGVEAGKGNIGLLIKDDQLYARLNGIAAEGQKLMGDIRHGNGTLSKLLYDDSLYQELRSPLKRVDAIMASLQAGQGTAGKLLKDPALYDEAHGTLVEIRGVVAEINAGKGTAGKLVKDEELYHRLDDLVAKFNTTVDKINSGQGSLGQFVTNPQFYEALTGTTQEFQALAKEIKANPKKFLTIRLVLF